MYPLLTPKISIYNRLEPRPRTEEFDKALKAEIADPLWLLTRQWQFGEFKGEDTGSSVFAKVKMKAAQMSHFAGKGQGPIEAVGDMLPMEAQVEGLQPEFDTKMSLQLSRYWKKLLDSRSLGHLFAAFRSAFPMTTTIAQTENAHELGNSALQSVLKVAAGKAMSGVALYNRIKYDLVHAGTMVLCTPAEANTLTQLGASFVPWVDNLYIGEEEKPGSWKKERLEYTFQTGIQEGAGEITALDTVEHYQGGLDWYAFDLNPSETAFVKHNTQGAGQQTELHTTLLPTQARFPGMPATRWWEFEDGSINFGRMDLNDADLGQLLLAQFGLLYSNDWSVIPFRVPAGSLCDVQEIVVTDVFGQRTLVQSASIGEPDNAPHKWGMFNLATTDLDGGPAQLTDHRLLVPATPTKLQESKPIEQIRFVRDEMANMVWGIEQVVPDGFGSGRDGHKAGQDLRRWLLQSAPQSPEENGLIYELVAGDLPENWIPFVPVKTNVNSLDQIRLQRGKLKRKLGGQIIGEVEPQTNLLATKDSQGQYQPLFLEESEIPKKGVTVKTTWQRCRWYDGKIVLWQGRRKNMGKGEGESGFRFDVVHRK